MAENRKPLLAILDGHGIIHRAYHALKDKPLSVRKTGEVTSGVFGFTNTLLTVLDDLKPTHLAVAMDLPGPTFRHARDASYKATRFEALKGQVVRSLDAVADLGDEAKLQIAEAVLAANNRDQIREGFFVAAERAGVAAAVRPELERALEPVSYAWEIGRQIERCLEMMEAFNIPVYSAPGFEADDVIGTLAKQAEAAGVETYLVTLDTDIIQLVRPGVTVYMLRPYQRDRVIYTPESAKERYKFDPERMPDFKALRGDASDNIPGIPGVGDTTATKLLVEFGSIDGIYARLQEVKPDKLRGLLAQFEGQVRQAREMATIETDVPGVKLDLENAQVGRYDRARVLDLMRQLEFSSLIERLPPEEKPAAAPEAPPPAPIEARYSLVTTAAALDALVSRLQDVGGFAFDIEATPGSPYHCIVIGVAVAPAPGEAYYVPVGHQGELGAAPQLALDLVLERLAPLFASPAIEKTSHNGKFDLALLTHRGRAVKGYVFDTALAAYILGETVTLTNDRAGAGSMSLKWLVDQRLKVRMREVADLLGKSGARRLLMSQVSAEEALDYVCENPDYTLRVRAVLEEELKAQNMWELFAGIEMPLVPVLAKMEAVGVAVDVAVLRELSQGLNEQIRYLEERAFSEIGHSFNLGSPPQLSQVLFEELGLPKTRRTKQGFSTDAQSIEALRGVHPIIELLLEWRQLTKLKSTYLDALPGLVDPRTGRIHTTFNQAVAATGRLSSNEPNLQNIPVRSELGGQVRRAFVARDIGPDPHLLAADYSQIELRILAHLSQDPMLIDAFRADEDIHAATAATVFEVPIDRVTRQMRDRAKVFNFGVLYGLTDYGLSMREGITREEAARFIKTYFEKYEAVKRWRDEIIASVRQHGYAETLAGRRRYIPDIHSPNFNLRSAAERMAINMPVQGTASDIIKIAMNRVDAELEALGFKSKMLLQVHDELIFEGPRAEMADLRDLLLRIMPASLDLAVPLKVDVKLGRNWADMEPFAG